MLIGVSDAVLDFEASASGWRMLMQQSGRQKKKKKKEEKKSRPVSKQVAIDITCHTLGRTNQIDRAKSGNSIGLGPSKVLFLSVYVLLHTIYIHYTYSAQIGPRLSVAHSSISGMRTSWPFFLR